MGLVYPTKCVLCGQALPVGKNPTMLCPACEQTMPVYRHTTHCTVLYADDAAAALFYKDKVRKAMQALKFRHQPHYATWFAQQAAEVLTECLDAWRPDLITFTPIGRLRMYQRGYNQAELIAKDVAQAVSLPCVATLRKRPFIGRQSKQKNAEARWKNAENAFLALPRVDLTGKAVVLVDDIITTGATASAATAVLRLMGASAVFVLAPTCAVLH